MKRNTKTGLALIALSLMVLGASPALARHHWGNGDGMWQQNSGVLNAEQQAAAQKIHNEFYNQANTLRQQLMSKRYEYNVLLTASSPDKAKINAVAKEMETLRQSLDELRVKRDVAMVEAGVPHGAGMGYSGCGGRGGGHMGMGRW